MLIVPDQQAAQEDSAVLRAECGHQRVIVDLDALDGNAGVGVAADDDVLGELDRAVQVVESTYPTILLCVGYLRLQALLTFLWVPFHDRPGSGGQRPPRVRSAMAISASGLW